MKAHSLPQISLSVRQDASLGPSVRHSSLFKHLLLSRAIYLTFLFTQRPVEAVFVPATQCAVAVVEPV